MTFPSRCWLFPCLLIVMASGLRAQVPEPLRPWEAWATWTDKTRNSPRPYSDSTKALPAWPTELRISATSTGATFELSVSVFDRTWVTLPGNQELWPMSVNVNGAPVPVLPRDGLPSVDLPPGIHHLSGLFLWKSMPQRLAIPASIGVLTLTVDDKAIEFPVWDAAGGLWLRRSASPGEETARDFLSVKIHSLIEDGIPMWLRTRVELMVSGKSREEDMGCVIPDGWSVSAVSAPIPVAVDDTGNLKAQVRAGKWIIELSAFRLDDLREITYAPGTTPAVADQLIGFRSKPEFRMVDIVGVPMVDVSQTTYPSEWRNLPVYRWTTSQPFKMEERMRGMGLQHPPGLTISRQLWLDEAGDSFTFRDNIQGTMQQIWRLDVAGGQQLGSVRSRSEGQLITANPQTGTPGVEVRSRNLSLEATGRMPHSQTLSASGWDADAENLSVTLNLPPGWRLLALFGGDWVRGDWLTSWTLLDLFVVLVFSLAVFRMLGFFPGVLAFLALALSYHEVGAPRFVWLALLIPIALLKVVPSGWPNQVIRVWKWLTVLVLILLMVPFLSKQVQMALFPQLEHVPPPVATPTSAPFAEGSAAPLAALASTMSGDAEKSKRGDRNAIAWKQSGNLLYDAKARIQTGPGVPEWTWRTVSFGWSGPVSAAQTFRPFLIPPTAERLLTVIRIALLLWLAALLLGWKKWRIRPVMAAAMVLLPLTSQAQFPTSELINTLRERLLETPDAFPNAAEIPEAALGLSGRKLTMQCKVHAAVQAGVPLPGRFPTWSPLKVTLDGKPAASLRRDDGFLWLVVPEGVHDVKVEGLLGEATEWEWTFLLKPRRVVIDAPGWTVTGVNPNGTPEAQVFFAQQQKSEGAAAAYDRQDFATVASVERAIELGLVWQVRTTVRRLSPAGKAISLRIPLLPGENVLSSNMIIRDGHIEVRLGAGQQDFSWQSELTISEALALTTRADDAWVERWQLTVSPVWNIAMQGLAPIFEPGNPQLVPVWNPWPGENVQLSISRPVAIPGATVTIRKATHTVDLGARQRTSTLMLSLICSLGEDFLIGLPADSQVTSITLNNQSLPVRMESGKVVVPLRPGEQNIVLNWRTDVPMDFQAKVASVILPIESANIETVVNVPSGRWVLATDGPLRGPAVRFWVVLVCSLLTALVLGRQKLSPLESWEWMLLALGLTQVPLVAALMVVAWLFLVAWRGTASFRTLSPVAWNLSQFLLVLATVCALVVFISVVGAGLLGDPEMFITGNGSTPSVLRWYQAHTATLLPQPSLLSISIWWYRLAMLAWALWLAASLVGWLQITWTHFTSGGVLKSTPPPLAPKG